MTRLLYFLFLLLFFRYAQADVLTYIESMMWGEPIASYPWLNAIGATGLLYAFFCLEQKTCGKFQRKTMSSYLDTASLAVCLVSFPFCSPLQLLLTILTGRILWGLNVWRVVSAKKKPINTSRRWQVFASSAIPLIFLCLFIGAGAAAKDTDHYELRTAALLRQSDYAAAYHIGERSIEGTPRLFALRCFLMAKTERGGLGGCFLTQPVPEEGGSRNLMFPDDERRHLLLSADSLYALLGNRPIVNELPIEYFKRCATPVDVGNGKIKYRKAAAEYYLCGLLLDGNVTEFSKEIKKYYPHEVSEGKLPRYYAQALLQYARSCPNPREVYQDAAVEQNYRDYVEMGDTIRNAQSRCNLLRRSYGETYWWWYDYGMKKEQTKR